MESSEQLETEGNSASETLRLKWPDIALKNSHVIGICAYVFGAIPAELMEKRGQRDMQTVQTVLRG